MRREGEGQSQQGGQLRAEQTGTEKPDRNPQSGARNSLNPLPSVKRLQVRLQLLHILRKTIGAGGRIAAQGSRSGHVGARRAAQTQIDATGIE
jgi:hypothetical protein